MRGTFPNVRYEGLSGPLTGTRPLSAADPQRTFWVNRIAAMPHQYRHGELQTALHFCDDRACISR